MPTITSHLTDLNTLSGLKMTHEQLDEMVTVFKGELKGYDADSDEIKIEILDTNRPDLWSVEGIARQLRFHETDSRPEYGFFAGGSEPVGTMKIDPAMADIRPYAAGFAVKNIQVTDDVLKALIQTQEKLTDNLGQHRKTVSIGLYDLDQIIFPVHYTAVGPDEVRFVPLGFEQSVTPAEILKEHPKGIEYSSILTGLSRVPMLMDDSRGILSFPPIINSRESGEVTVGLRNLFVEATGTHLDHVLLALNIMAVNFHDRGAFIEPVRIEYPYDTPHGRQFAVPYDFNHAEMSIAPVDLKKHLGASFQAGEIAKQLSRYGYETRHSDELVTVKPLNWRHDILHKVDIMEDFAISLGYEAFEPLMPTDYTTGMLDGMTLFGDRIRDIVVAFGFEEVISNILCHKGMLSEKMNEENRDLVEIKNPMTENFSALRDRILPSLLNVEQDSSSAIYPHHIFEVGEVTVHDVRLNTGCDTRMKLAVLIADKESEISTVHAFLETLLYNLGLESTLESRDFPEFIPGRSGIVFVKGQDVGRIGEINPAVLEKFQIGMPCASFELDLHSLEPLIDLGL